MFVTVLLLVLFIMLGILSGEVYDYSELTDSYMDFFNTQGFYQFLNTTQTGSAHTSSGTELSLLLQTVFTSLSLCLIQLTMFCFFRNIFKSIYQPRCYCVPTNERVEPLPKGLLGWIKPTVSYGIHYYLALGLDAYFFIRFVSMLLLFFIIIGGLNMIILIPINLAGSDTEFTAMGLDRLSVTNVSPSKVQYLNSHFFMAIITISVFHWLIIYELESFIKIRLAFLSSSRHLASPLYKTLLINNVTRTQLDRETMINLFSVFPGGVRHVWFLSDYRKIGRAIAKIKDAVQYLEAGELIYLKRYHRKYGDTLSNQVTISEYVPDHQLRPFFYPPMYRHWTIPIVNTVVYFKTPGWWRWFFFEKRVDQIDWAATTIKDCKKLIQDEKVLLARNKLKKFKTVFIQFNTQEGANIAHQCLLSQKLGNMDQTLINIHPRDIYWNSLTKSNPYHSLLENYSVSIILIMLLVLYVIPVSFIGLISQVPLITQLMPFMRWVYRLPEEARNSISSLLPSILLSVLTELTVVIFRFLIVFRTKLTGAEIELDLQTWYFAFLFIQQFLVVTILSSITVIFKQVVDQPTSIPVMLATNLPKAAIFFFQFIAVKALSFCGNNFLRINQLISNYFYHKFFDKTPRRKFATITNLSRVKWGTVYPVFSVYASIGLTYSIISPLISIFVIFILVLVLLYYKYSLRYIYSHINESETYGRLYPTALLYLYSGIYCLECCLIGIFFLLQNSSGNNSLKIQGWIMTGILLMTIFGNITIYERYSKYSSCFPVLRDNDTGNNDTGNNDNDNNDNDDSQANMLNLDMLYLHPYFKYEVPKVWLPKDVLGIAETELLEIKQKYDVEGLVTDGAIINFSPSNKFLSINITGAPPDYK